MTLQVLDRRFLTVHARTALWWKQRDQCQRCEHFTEPPLKGIGRNSHGGGMVCLLADTSCITARDEGRACGPDAKLFKETACL